MGRGGGNGGGWDQERKILKIICAKEFEKFVSQNCIIPFKQFETCTKPFPVASLGYLVIGLWDREGGGN